MGGERRSVVVTTRENGGGTTGDLSEPLRGASFSGFAALKSVAVRAPRVTPNVPLFHAQERGVRSFHLSGWPAQAGWSRLHEAARGRRRGRRFTAGTSALRAD